MGRRCMVHLPEVRRLWDLAFRDGQGGEGWALQLLYQREAAIPPHLRPHLIRIAANQAASRILPAAASSPAPATEPAAEAPRGRRRQTAAELAAEAALGGVARPNVLPVLGERERDHILRPGRCGPPCPRDATTRIPPHP